MNKRIFVDCDDTLILYLDGNTDFHPYGIYHGIPWIVNERLLRGVQDFIKENPTSLVIIWSGGGREYAKYWVDILNLNGHVIPLTKDKTTFNLVRKGDIVVDDMDLGGLRTHGPYEWP